jgi:class 3 adenylate cyclase/tetratricopeptide (TPR) repeat protein
MSPYVPRLLPPWAAAEHGVAHRCLDASLVLIDVSGFTRLTERLAGRGREGAEELSDILHAAFTPLIAQADDEGADLLKWGGDAVLLLLDGPAHQVRAARAAARMQRALNRVGHLATSVGRVVLRASTGVHSGPVDLILAGDPDVHRELMVVGPGATAVAALDAAAEPGQIVLADSTAASLDPNVVGARHRGGVLLAGMPARAPVPAQADYREGAFSTSLLPSQLRVHLAQPRREPEHRTVAVAFVRFDGTDRLLAEDGAEALALAVDELVRNVQDATSTHQVAFHETDIDVDGGKVMIVAGAPLSAGDDTDRLLDAMRLVVERAGRIPVRVGLARGRVFTGDLGPQLRRTYSVKGDAVNLAARLAGKAAPGALLAASDVLDHARSTYDLTPLPGLTVRGLSRKVHAVGIGRARTNPRAHIPTTLLVGRDGELAVLDAELGRLRQGVGSVVQVVGEAGLGKSRLVEEVVAHAADLRVLLCDCERTGAGTPYAPIRRLLRDLLGIGDEHDRDAAAARALEQVTAISPGSLPWVPLLAGVLDLELPGGPEIAELEERYRVERLEATVAGLLQDALPVPTLLVVEDAHLADPASAGVLARIAQRTADLPWLLLASRAERKTGWVPADARTITLEPLPPAASVALAEVVTQHNPLPPVLVETLAERAGGHPLFLNELVRAAERGERVDELPASMEALLAVEVDRLVPAERSLLRRAAVLGTTFTTDLLATMLEGEDDLVLKHRVLPKLLAGVNSFLVEAGPGRLRFRHALMREVAYAGLPFRRRRELHARAAEVLESSTSAAARRPELLALHYFVAQRYDEAWHYARRAGRRAAERNAPAAAAEAYERAAEAARRSPGVTEIERAADLEALGDALFLAGRSPESANAYREARRAVRADPLRSAELALKQARVAHRQGKYSLALRRISTGLRALQGAEGVEAAAARARLRTRYAVGRFSQGRYTDARRVGEQAVAEAREAGERNALAQAHLVLHSVDVWSGEPEKEPHGQIALALFEQLGDLSGEAHALNNLASRRFFEGNWPVALAMFARAADTFRRVGDAANAANATYNQADMLIRQGHNDRAEPLLEEALRVARGVGDEELVAFVKLEQGRSRSRDGRLADGLALLDDARLRFTELGEPHGVVDTDIAIAEAHLLAGLSFEARALVEGVLDSSASVGAATLMPAAHRVHAAALLACGEPALARAALDEGLRLSASPELGHERGFLLAVAARLERRTGGGGALRLDAQAQAALDSLGVVRVPMPVDL